MLVSVIVLCIAKLLNVCFGEKNPHWTMLSFIDIMVLFLFTVILYFACDVCHSVHRKTWLTELEMVCASGTCV